MELNRVSNLLLINRENISVRNNFNKSYTNNSNLISPDTLFINRPVRSNFYNVNIFSSKNMYQIKQIALKSADYEWRLGVKETHGKNRSPRIDQYAKNSSFGVGGEWCGFFLAFNYSQAGFKYPSSLAGMKKSRDFFLYRSYTNLSKNSELEQLRLQHKQNGNERKFFLLEESPSINYIKNNKNKYSYYNVEQNTFKYYNLPIEPGDTVLFGDGINSGHIGMVVSYDKNNGKLVTIEGNTMGRTINGKIENGVVAYQEYDLKNPKTRAKIAGFGRPSIEDFNS